MATDTQPSMTAGARSKVKSSVQRGIRSKVEATYPLLCPYMDDIMPKKEQIDLVKLYVFIPLPLASSKEVPNGRIRETLD